jgi:hypothetical protein
MTRKRLLAPLKWLRTGANRAIVAALGACVCVYRRRRPDRGKRILLITDSRGLNLTRRPFMTYADWLSCCFRVDKLIYPRKWTTVADLHELLNAVDRTQYDVIIAHVGISDFSPRSKSSVSAIYEAKRLAYDSLFGRPVMSRHLEGDLQVAYEGEVTSNMFSLAMLHDSFVPWLASFEHLIYVTGNPILKDWAGDYWRRRPENIEVANDYMRALEAALPRTFSCMDWSVAEVMRHTTDSVHLNARGHAFYGRRLTMMCEQMMAMGGRPGIVRPGAPG